MARQQDFTTKIHAAGIHRGPAKCDRPDEGCNGPYSWVKSEAQCWRPERKGDHWNQALVAPSEEYHFASATSEGRLADPLDQMLYHLMALGRQQCSVILIHTM